MTIMQAPAFLINLKIKLFKSCVAHSKSNLNTVNWNCQKLRQHSAHLSFKQAILNFAVENDARHSAETFCNIKIYFVAWHSFSQNTIEACSLAIKNFKFCAQSKLTNFSRLCYLCEKNYTIVKKEQCSWFKHQIPTVSHSMPVCNEIKTAQ